MQPCGLDPETGASRARRGPPQIDTLKEIDMQSQSQHETVLHTEVQR